MNDQELQNRLKNVEDKVEKIFISTEKTRKYFLWTLIVTVVFMVLPLIGLLFAIPSFVSTYSSLLNY